MAFTRIRGFGGGRGENLMDQPTPVFFVCLFFVFFFPPAMETTPIPFFKPGQSAVPRRAETTVVGRFLASGVKP